MSVLSLFRSKAAFQLTQDQALLFEFTILPQFMLPSFMCIHCNILCYEEGRTAAEAAPPESCFGMLSPGASHAPGKGNSTSVGASPGMGQGMLLLGSSQDKEQTGLWETKLIQITFLKICSRQRFSPDRFNRIRFAQELPLHVGEPKDRTHL